jgi:hypothetical protein
VRGKESERERERERELVIQLPTKQEKACREAGRSGAAGSEGEGLDCGLWLPPCLFAPLGALATGLCWRTEEMLPKAAPPSCHRL